MSFFKEVIAKLIQAEFEGHTTFSVADNTAIGDNPIRVLHLDAVPAGDNVLISLSWEGGDKVFEKQLSSEEAQHQFDLISTDLAEAVALTQKGEYDAAKEVMTQLTQKYAENTGEIVQTNLPTLNHNQASKDDSLLKQAKITMQNLFFSTSDELMDYQKKMKELQPKNDADKIPLWDKMNGDKPEGEENPDLLAPGNLSYEDAEKEKEKEHKNIDKQIKEQVKTEVESAMIEKAATVFGPDQVELVKVLKKNGRNWDEIKKILTKDFNFDKDATTIFVDEQRQAAEGIAPEEDKEVNPMAPPKDLVPDEVHDELLQDIEDKKEDIKPEGPAKEKSLPLKDLMDIPEDEPVEEPIEDKSSITDISRADNSEIRKAAASDQCNCGHQGSKHSTSGICTECDKCSNFKVASIPHTKECNDANDKHVGDKEICICEKKASQEKIALNPLQVPPAPAINEKPEEEGAAPAEDMAPAMPEQPADAHPAPQPGDRVFVSSELGAENPGFEAKFVSDYTSKGTKFSIVEKDDGQQENVESHRMSTIAPTEKMPEPAVAPEIESAAQEPEIAVTPKQNDLYSSLDDIKAETVKLEAQLKELEAESVMDTKCEGCGKPLGPEAFLSSHPVCGDCTKKRHKKVTGEEKEAAPGDAPAAEAPKPATTLKDVKITPDKVDKEKAIPASPDQAQLIEKLQSIEAKLGQLEQARESLKAQYDAEVKKVDQAGERSTLEAEYKGEIEKLGVSVELVSSQLIKYNGMFVSFRQEEKTIEVKPNYKDLMSRIYEKFEGAEKYIQSVMNGMQSLAKDVTTRTLTRWPEKRSELGKAASLHDELAQMNAELLQALKLLSEPIA